MVSKILRQGGLFAAGGSSILAFGLVVSSLLWAAIWNGFPLIFPDSGTYLLIAFDRFYAIDRSSFYGLFLKPFVTLVPGLAGLWVALAVQAGIVASLLVIAARQAVPGIRPALLAGLIAAVALLSSLSWHAGQFMPDAFTGVLVLAVWAAATRDPTDDGAPALWCAATLLALTHYTHLPLLFAAGTAAILVQARTGLDTRGIGRRLAALCLSGLLCIAALIAANGAALGRWSVAPMGPVFLFARLNGQDLVTPWLDRHCGRDAPSQLCAVRHELPRDSQVLLWNADRSPLYGRVFLVDEDKRWAWVDTLAAVNGDIVTESPLTVAGWALRDGARQFFSFAAQDDECPEGCRDPRSGITYILSTYRPSALPALRASRQVTDRTSKPFFRAITTATGGLSLALLSFAFWRAWTRRDRLALSLAACLVSALIANAAVTGALSGVHDRYQSRVIWLATFGVALIVLRWNINTHTKQHVITKT